MVCFLLVALGCFCLLLAAMLPFYVYPKVAVLPDDPQQGATLTSPDTTVLVADAKSSTGVRELRHVEVRTVSFVSEVRDVATQGSVVWQIATQTFVEGHGMVNAQVERISLNRRTAKPTNCCGDRLVTDSSDARGQSLRHDGYVVWPFNIQKKSYQIWDVNLQKAGTANFVGTETKLGIRTYKFRSVVSQRQIGTQELPGSLFGVKDASVVAKSLYADTTTYWIAPASGAVISTQDQVDREFSYAGRTVTAFSGTLTTVHSSTDADVVKLRQGEQYLPWLRSRGSIALVALGLVLLVAAGFAASPRRR